MDKITLFICLTQMIIHLNFSLSNSIKTKKRESENKKMVTFSTIRLITKRVFIKNVKYRGH